MFKRPRDDDKSANVVDLLDPEDPNDEYEEDAWENETWYDEGAPHYDWRSDEDLALIAVDQNPLYRGCMAADTGCSCSVSSLAAADILQVGRQEEEGALLVTGSPN